ncbi:conserved exported hypothetical protein [Burkholderia sp. 8Y]|uniref:DUF4148 domain-containing protein n=1 Tax=Burkholderia sp. 8Y TaxID=2653133 RepID=UPI0012F1085B|nr:DUF4148 domain-containing protein [Burkholderia sp. 8Y]VXC71161.1 conserved exported hypothetical protein [Burkholderia sp. 8Y]
MKTVPINWPMLSAWACLLAGCAAGSPPQNTSHLTPTQCRDLAAIRNNAPPNRERNASELTALRQAGYDPSRWFDPYYPEDLQAAQRQIDVWFRTDCPPAARQAD